MPASPSGQSTRMLVFGASGTIGRAVVAEALARGHAVTGVARDPSVLGHAEGLVTLAGDARDPELVRELAREHDVVVATTRPRDGHERELVDVARTLLVALAGLDARLILVGGAASLAVPDRPGVRVLDDPRYIGPPWRAIAEACVEQHAVWRDTGLPRATYLSPPASLEAGPRTGRYRVAADTLVVDPDGRSRVHVADLAVALVDEIEAPRWLGARFTVGD